MAQRQQSYRNVPGWDRPSDRSFVNFEQKMKDLLETKKRKAAASKVAKNLERNKQQQTWCRQMKRTQRYLGLRARTADVRNLGLLGPTPGSSWDITQPAPHPFDFSVVFICVDVEAYEHNTNLVTEIGISTLDTHDLRFLPPGEGGSAWMRKIRCRHFRVSEHANLRNRTFVKGCPENFDFGQTEWIGKEAAAEAVAECFRYPFSAPTSVTTGGMEQNADGNRNIVLVGHAVENDVAYLTKMGFNPLELPSFLEAVDTAILWRAFKRDSCSRALEMVLYELGLAGWNLHNAGNDAAYTLQAMVALAFRGLQPKEISRAERALRIEAAIKEAEQRAMEECEGWSTVDEDDDGGFVAMQPARRPEPLDDHHYPKPSTAVEPQKENATAPAQNGRAAAQPPSHKEPPVSPHKTKMHIQQQPPQRQFHSQNLVNLPTRARHANTELAEPNWGGAYAPAPRIPPSINPPTSTTNSSSSGRGRASPHSPRRGRRGGGGGGSGGRAERGRGRGRGRGAFV